MVELVLSSIVLGSTMSVTLSPSLPQLHVSGNQVLDRSGHPVVLDGVNCASLEWSVDGQGHILDTVKVATQDWKANIIRVPLSEDRWFGKTEEQKDGGTAYRALVKKVVDEANKERCYVLLDLHWNDADEWGKNIGQHKMPDQNSLAFWKDCASSYRNRPGVLFDLYNEPHDVSWDVWLKGGEVKETKGDGARQGKFVPVTYQTPGMQALLDQIRGTGAKNLVVCGGLDWAYDLSGFLKGYQLQDTKGFGVIYACHNYPFKGDAVAKWEEKMDAALPTIPVIMSEFGADGATVPNPWIQEVLKYADAHHMNYTAWDLHPAAGPILISDWKYTPTPAFGALVKADLATKQN
jgi:endoglucanase